MPPTGPLGAWGFADLERFAPITPSEENLIRIRVDEIPVYGALSFRIIQVRRGLCIATVPRNRSYDGIFDTFHGGMLLTVADSAAAIAVLTTCGADAKIATTDMGIRFLAPATDDVVVRMEVIKTGRTLVPLQGELRDQYGGPLAICQVTYIRLPRT